MRRKHLCPILSFYTLACLLVVNPMAALGDTGHQALINPDFSQPLVGDDPPGWFRAMMPGMTESLEAGRGEDDGEFFIYMTQKGPRPNLFNNWAQRLDHPPIGATLTLTADLATSGVSGPGAAALIMLFDDQGNDCGSVSSEGDIHLTGDTPFTPVSLKAVVPPQARTAIVRFGLIPGSEGTLKIRRASLIVSGGADASPVPESRSRWEAGVELLTNGDFEGRVILGNPAGWFRAMLPDRTVDLQAGVEEAAERGHVAFIEQSGLKARVINNWAQRLDIVPVGATLRVQAEVKTRDLPENTGFVMVQCWGAGEQLLAGATTQISQPLGGTADWKTVSCEVTVPPETESIILRCGLAGPGRIWFDNVSLKIIRAPAPSVVQSGVPGPPDQSEASPGVRVDAAYLKQLDLARAISKRAEAAARETLPDGAEIRTEVFALGDGKFDVIVHLDLADVGTEAGADATPGPGQAEK